KQRFAITSSMLFHNPGLFKIRRLFDMEQIFKFMLLRSDHELKLLDRALHPVGELQMGNIMHPISTEDTVASTKIADQPQRIEHRTLTRSVLAAQNSKRVEFRS